MFIHCNYNEIRHVGGQKKNTFEGPICEINITITMGRDFIFIPKSNTPTSYVGGYEPPKEWKWKRFIKIAKADDQIRFIIKGNKIAPQDRDALLLFESYYSQGKSVMTYNGNKLCLSIEQCKYPDDMDDQQIFDLLLDCYKVLELRKTDYTEEVHELYYSKNYDITISRYVHTPNTFDLSTNWDLAPDVFVRP